MNSVERPIPPSDRKLGWGSDAAAQILRDLGYRYVALTPGSSTRGFHDSVVNYLGNREPQLLLCLHEEHAVAIAHGYAKVTGKPMAAALHTNVGAMHGSMAIFNAFCDRVPMLVLGSNGPMDAAQRGPWIYWTHTTADNGALLRGYLKWDDQPASVPALLDSLIRASKITRTAPQAPVYVVMEAGIQEQAVEPGLRIPSVTRYQPLADPRPDGKELERAVEALRKARRPVILAGRVSRAREDWDARVKLAECLGALVVTDIRVSAAFPTNHPLHVGAPGWVLSSGARQIIREADVILSLDWLDLAGSLAEVGAPEQMTATLITATVDDYLHNGWSKDHQALAAADIGLAAPPDVSVHCLLEEVRRRHPKPRAWEDRQRHLVRSPAINDPFGAIALSELASLLQQALVGTPTCLTRVPLGWHEDVPAWPFEGPLDYIGYDGGGGLGSGPGMAIGAALALKDEERMVVSIMGDGDFTMGMSALWTAARYRLPMLIVIANNQSYFNDELHQDRIARLRNRPRANRWIGQQTIDPDIDCAALARAQGVPGYGPVVDRRELPKVLQEAISVVRNGSPAVIDVRVGREYGNE